MAIDLLMDFVFDADDASFLEWILHLRLLNGSLFQNQAGLAPPNHALDLHITIDLPKTLL